MVTIENEDILKSPEHRKKILSALRRVEKACREITELGYMLYLSAHGNLNVLNIDDVPFKHNLDFHSEQLVAVGTIDSIDAGDW